MLIFLLVSSYGYCQLNTCDENLVLLDGCLYANATKQSNNPIANVVYKPESIYVFSYKYIDQSGKEMLFYVNRDGSWDFADKNSPNENVVRDFKLEVLKKQMHFKSPDHFQSQICYSIDKDNLHSTETGLVENSKNIWMHPPRAKLFAILELNPFPYVKYPLKVGETWEWSLKIGGHWSDKRWKVWSGSIENKYQYKIVGKEMVQTDFGALDCYVIESHAKSELGITKLVSYFNEQYGFVKLDYSNINNSKLEIKLKGKGFSRTNFLPNGM